MTLDLPLASSSGSGGDVATILFLILGGVFCLGLPILLFSSFHFVNYNHTFYSRATSEEVAQGGVRFGSGWGFRVVNRSPGTLLVETEPKINWALFFFLMWLCGWGCLVALFMKKRENISILGRDLSGGTSEIVVQAFVQGRHLKEVKKFVQQFDMKPPTPAAVPKAIDTTVVDTPALAVSSDTETLWSVAADAPTPPMTPEVLPPPPAPASPAAPPPPTSPPDPATAPPATPSRLRGMGASYASPPASPAPRPTPAPPPAAAPAPSPSPAPAPASEPEPEPQQPSRLRGTMGRKDKDS